MMATSKTPTPTPKLEVQKPATLSDRLRSKLATHYARNRGTDRVRNRSLPVDPLFINDWPADLEYDWIPAPGGTAPDMHGTAEMAQLRAAYVQKGWQFYPPEEFATEPGMGLPWLVQWENENGKVRLMDMWLVYADKDMEARARRDNLERWNRHLDEAKETRRVEGGKGMKGTASFVESERGQAKAIDILREGEE